MGEERRERGHGKEGGGKRGGGATTLGSVHSHISRGVAIVAGSNRAKSQECVCESAQLNEQLVYPAKDCGTRKDCPWEFKSALKYATA